MAALDPLAAGRKKEIFGWAMFDFANSPFTTLVVTFVYATFFTKAIAENEVVGTALWSRGVTITALVVALASPLLGAVADRGGYRKRFLVLSTLVTIAGCLALYRVLPGQPIAALVWFVTANIAFEMGMVFYNAFLPDIAPAQRIGTISGLGWALGYFGGLLALVVALLTLVQPETPWFGFSKQLGENIRATNLLVALWFAIFSLPTFLLVRERQQPSGDVLGVIRDSYRQLGATLHDIRRYRQIVRFLVARLFYNDGLVTIFAFGGIYAAGTFGFDFQEILVFGIVLNVMAGAGAFAMGRLDDVLGGKRTVMLSIAGLSIATLLAVLAPNRAVFWVAGILVGIFSGPNQAASRSLMGRFVPHDKENEFFGFFAFSGKATAFLGPLLLGVLTEVFGTQRAGIAIVLVLFLIGGVLLLGLDEAAGIRAAAAMEGVAREPGA